MTPIKNKIVNLNLHNDNDRVLDFSDFQKQTLQFDIDKLQDAYNQIVKIKKFEDAGVTNFGAISLTQIPGDPDSIKGNKARGVYWTKPDKSGKEVSALEDFSTPKEDKKLISEDSIIRFDKKKKRKYAI